MPKSETPEKLAPYLDLGVDLTWTDSKSSADCPFPECGKHGTFSVLLKTGQYRCASCGQSGNVYSLMARIIKDSLIATDEAAYLELASDRNLLPSTLRAWHFCVSIFTNEWILPMYNEKGVPVNILRLVQQDGKWKPLSISGCKLHLLGTHLITSQQIIHLAEGIWDGPALWEITQGISTRGIESKASSSSSTSGIESKPSFSSGLRGERLVPTKDPSKSISPKEGVLAAPGAGAFQEDWLVHLNGKIVNLLYDNDHPKVDATGKIRLVRGPGDGRPLRPGWDGMQRVAKIINESSRQPKALHQLLWTLFEPAVLPDTKLGYINQQDKPVEIPVVGFNPGLPDGFDIRDLKKKVGPLKCYSLLTSSLDRVQLTPIKSVDGKQARLEPIPRTTFEELCRDYTESLHFTQQLRDTLAIMLATIISTEYEGDGIWLRVIGPPGSGKTTLAEACSAAREYIMPKSILTGFHSGYIGGDSDKERKEDASLIPQMQNKTIIMKDGDTLITHPRCHAILGELRDIYDGASRNSYRNRKKQDYEDIRMTFILCGTDELRRINHTNVGERFLDCEILAGEETRPYLQRAFSNTLSKVMGSMFRSKHESFYGAAEANANQSLFLKRVTYGLIKYYKENIPDMQPPSCSPEAENQLIAMAELLSYLRARVKRENGQEVSYRPRAELATRLSSQFAKLSICLSLLFGKQSIDTEVLRVVRKVMFDSGTGFQLEVIRLLVGQQMMTLSPNSQALLSHSTKGIELQSSCSSQSADGSSPVPAGQSKLSKGGIPSKAGNADLSPSNKTRKSQLIVGSIQTAIARQLDSIRAAAHLPPTPAGLSCRQISSELNLPESTVRRLLEDLQEFNLVARCSVANNSGQRGRDSHLWQASPLVISLWSLAHLSLDASDTSA